MSTTTNLQGSGFKFDKLYRPFSNIGVGADGKTGKFVEEANKIIEENKGNSEDGIYSVFQISDKSLAYPVVVLTDTRYISNEKMVFYSILVFGSACRFSEPTKEIKWPDNHISTLILTPDEIYNSKGAASILAESVISEVTKRAGVDEQHTTLCGDFVVQDIKPADNIYENRDFVVGWLRVLSNATCTTYLNILKDEGLLDKPEEYYFNSNYLKGYTSVGINFNDKQLFGLSGEPIRRDLEITLHNSLNNLEQSPFIRGVDRRIVSISGYVDTTWNGTTQQTAHVNRYLRQSNDQFNGYAPYPAQQREKVYTPLAIITNFENHAGENVPPTLEVVISGILAFSVVCTPDIWKRTYDLKYLSEDTPYNVMATLPETNVVIPEGEEFHYDEYMEAFWEENPGIAIDIDRNGPNYWALKSFIDPAGEHEILRACENFFGNFGFKWDKGDKIVFKTFELQGGYYATGKEIRDIRELDDYIYMLNVLGTDQEKRPDDVRDRDIALDMLEPGISNLTQEQRFSTRYRIINAIANNSFQPTTSITRVVLNPKFVSEITRTAIAAGININLTNRQIDDGRNVRRGLGLAGATYHPNGNLFYASNRNNYRSY
jgi:hypothetical protein